MISLNAEQGPPASIMLIPNGVVKTLDGRGPYKVGNAAKLAADSLAAAGGKILIDENHSTDLAAPKGEPAPARGWITQLHARADGIYGDVDWTPTGSALMREKAYRGISPVVEHDASGNVLLIHRVSLTNTPNFKGMRSLHAQGATMDEFLQQLRAALGLSADADQAAVVAAAKKCASYVSMNSQIAKAAGLKEDAGAELVLSTVTALKSNTALQSALAPIAKAAGVKEDSDAASIASAVTALATAAKSNGAETIVALQSELKDMATKLNTLTADGAKQRATAYVDGEIAKGRVGVKAMRDTYIDMHMKDSALAEKLIGAMPILGPSGALTTPPSNNDGKIALNAEQKTAAKLLGLKEEDYAKTLATEQQASAA
ncbi:MAG TPA: phage protease [Thermomicrobiales bacterium]|nr:phage protease [Thermomicrobiales bacterium]